jgi:diguanylate cyclase (GGDEF)-like protein/PAS domain S-box-containing protein
VWVLDPVTLRFRYVSPSVERCRGYTPEEVMSQPMDAALTPEYSALLKEQIRRNMDEFKSGNSPDKVYVEELQQPHKDGSLVWTEAIARFFYNDENGQVEIHGVTRNISERRAAQEKIHYMAMHDLLTGLPNRTLLNDRLQQSLIAAKRDEGRLALMFVDLDNFKQINDTLGHDIGDELLRLVAVRMQDCVRESDTVARIGGDEFIVLLRVVENEHDAMRVADKICAGLSQTFELTGQSLSISCSIGVSLYPEHGNDAVELTKNADIAMYRAKESGRNNVHLFSNV